LCSSLALVARRLCTDVVDPDGVSALVACHLIALNKCPGVHPIGVGEVVRRIIGKAVLTTPKMEILEAAGPLQLCAGQDAGWVIPCQINKEFCVTSQILTKLIVFVVHMVFTTHTNF